MENTDRIETNNLVLRKARLSDLDSIYANVWSDLKLTEYMGWKISGTKEEASERLARTIDFQKHNLSYFVCAADTDEAIGFAGIRETEEKGIYSETGICIAGKYQGRGFGRKTVGALKKLIFEGLHGSGFIYSFFEGNIPSEKLCLSSGFRYLGSEEATRWYDGKNFIKKNYFFDREMYEKQNASCRETGGK